MAAARAAEADEAAKKADQARLVAVAASREAAKAMMPVRVAENLKLRAEAQAGQRATVLQLPAKPMRDAPSYFGTSDDGKGPGRSTMT